MVSKFVAASLLMAVRGQDLFLAFPESNSTCMDYKVAAYDKCSDCGTCKNAGARPGVLCKGQATGYLCPPEWQEGQDMAFACMDWTFGSGAMRDAEAVFNKKYNEDVMFGVGTFGTAEDPYQGLGNCYRLEVEGMDRPLLLQSINTGSDVSGNQFDMQIGAGGAGAFNTCAGGKSPGVDSMYPGTYDLSNWGRMYGGVDNKTQCKNLPPYPAVSGPMKAAGDSLVALCEYGFDHGARMEGGRNPSILSIGRVKCPEELVHMTQLQRNDDPEEFTCGSKCQKAPHPCQLDKPGATAEWCLTRMMDCRKPSGAWTTNTGNTLEKHRVVQTCTSDGYTRLDVQCGCFNCWC